MEMIPLEKGRYPVRIKITADSTCDLPLELRERYDVTLAPLAVVVNEDVHYDGVDICQQEIFGQS